MADFDADKLGKRLEQLNREQLAELEQQTARLLRELGPYRAGPKRADGSAADEPHAADRSPRARRRSDAR